MATCPKNDQRWDGARLLSPNKKSTIGSTARMQNRKSVDGTNEASEGTFFTCLRVARLCESVLLWGLKLGGEDPRESKLLLQE